MNYFDSNRDPANSNTISGAFFWMSIGSTGTTIASATTNFDNLIISASPNFPPDGSSMTRYFVNLPGEPYYSDIVAGNSTFVIKNINTSTVLTRVAPATVLTANTYKIFDSNSDRRGCMEVHVGTGSNQPGDALAFHGRFITSILGSTHFQRIEDYFTSKNKIRGITIANSTGDSDHDLDFGAGYVYNETETRKLTFVAMTKKLDSTFASGSSAGMLVDSTAIGINQDYYLYAIGKNNYSTSADYIASTNSTNINGVAPTLPSGWTNYKLIGICQTNSTANIYQGQWSRPSEDRLRFRFKNFNVVYANAGSGSTRILLTAVAPINSYCDFTLMQDTGSMAYINYGETFEPDNAPTTPDDCKFYFSSNDVCVETVLKIDSNKQIFYRSSYSVTLAVKQTAWMVDLY